MYDTNSIYIIYYHQKVFSNWLEICLLFFIFFVFFSSEFKCISVKRKFCWNWKLALIRCHLNIWISLIRVNKHPFWNPISLFALICDRINLFRVIWCTALFSCNKVYEIRSKEESVIVSAVVPPMFQARSERSKQRWSSQDFLAHYHGTVDAALLGRMAEVGGENVLENGSEWVRLVV